MADVDIGRAFDCVQCGARHEATRGTAPKAQLCRTCYLRQRNTKRIDAMGGPAAWNAYCRERRARLRGSKACARCAAPLPKGKSKYCSASCLRAATVEGLRVGVERTGQCGHCHSSFVTIRPNQRYCSRRCKDKMNSRRPSEARPLYRYARWLHLRKAQLKAEPTCRFCSLAGIETAATVCDHVHPHRGNVEAFWSGPFQSLCTECHNRDKQRMERSAA